ncbi:hypothetical protein GRQ15_23695 [Escherichia coli]|nr:hypothetical protein [Escherichia coli]
MPSGVKDIQLLELKDTISQLNKTISTQNELISSLQKMLEERNAKDSEKDLLIANLQSQLAYLKNKVFGSTSEIRHDQLDGQLNLFGTPVGDEKPAEVIEPEVISVKGYTKERKPKATYDDKYNSVRSICKHFFTDIVGLSIKFFCVSLRHMSIASGMEARQGGDSSAGSVHDSPPRLGDARESHKQERNGKKRKKKNSNHRNITSGKNIPDTSQTGRVTGDAPAWPVTLPAGASLPGGFARADRRPPPPAPVSPVSAAL